MSQNEPSSEEIRNATTDGLKRIYLILVGLAIAAGMHRVFGHQALIDLDEPVSFAGGQNFVHLFLLTIFLLYAVTFAHGSLLHLTAFAEQKKWLVDWLLLFIQAILFFLAALSLGNMKVFLVVLCVILAIDTIWLLLLSFLLKKMKKIERWWIIMNGIFYFSCYVLYIQFSLEDVWVSGILAGIVFFMKAVHYVSFREEIFPK